MCLQEELAQAQRKIHQLERDHDDSGPLITRPDTTDDIVRVLFDWLPASKRAPVILGLMQSLKSTAPRPKIKRPGACDAEAMRPG